MMDDKRLQEIKARAEAATPGPWVAQTNRHPQCNGEPWGWVSGAEENTTWSGRRGKANAEFIAHSRTDIPDLLAEVERLGAELAEAHSYIFGDCGATENGGAE